MKLSECEIGDVIKDGRRVLEFCGTTFDNKFVCKVIESTYIAELAGTMLIYSRDTAIFELVSRKSNDEKSLEQQIQEKEIELENLKTKLRESNVKKVLDNLDPNTIYKIVHDGFEEVGFVFKGIDNCSIYGINMKQIGTVPTKNISKIFPLKDATETYHKLQLLLKNS